MPPGAAESEGVVQGTASTRQDQSSTSIAHALPKVAAIQADVKEQDLQGLLALKPLSFCPGLLQGSISAVLNGLVKSPESIHATPLAKLADFFLSSTKLLHTSKESIAKLTGVPPDRVEPNLSLLANTMLHMDQVSRRDFEKMISTSGMDLVAYIELSRYDETPMKVGQQHSVPAMASSAKSTPTTWSSGSLGPSSSSVLQDHLNTATPSKLFSIENKVLMILKMPNSDDTADPADPGFIAVLASNLTSHRILSRATGDVLMSCLLDASSTSEHASGFHLKMRATTTDQAGSNNTAEQGVLQKRPGWTGLHLPCLAHIVAGCFSKTFQLMESDVSGMLHFALFLGFGSNMLKFRESLLAVATSLPLHVVVGVPSEDVLAHRKFVLDTLCNTGRNLAVRRYLLQTFATGDWKKTDCIEVYVRPGQKYEAEELRAKVANALVLGLTGTLFRVYPRHRWLGADITVDQIALCQSVHGLASAAVRHMLTGSLPRDSDMPEPELGDAGTSDMLFPPGTLSSGSRVPQEEAEQHASVGEEVFMDPAEMDVDRQGNVFLDPTQSLGDADFQAKLNSRNRKKAQQWLNTQPLPRLQLMRLCMQPLTQLLKAVLYNSSDEAAMHEDAKIAAKQAAGEGPESLRQSPLLSHVTQRDTGLFFQELSRLLASESWQQLHSSVHTLEFQALAFRLTSRMGALVHQLLMFPTSLYPLALFDMVVDPVLTKREIGTLRRETPCVLDAFTLDFLTAFPDPAAAEALTTLTTLSWVMPMDTVRIEEGHGRLNRLLRSQSVQTHTPTFSYMNAQQVCLRHRERQKLSCVGRARAFSGRRGEQRGQESEDKAPKSDAQSQSSRGGGAWRAFTSQQTRWQEGRPDWAFLSLQYQDMKRKDPEQFRKLEAQGQAATAYHQQTGAASFGPSSREIRRKQLKRMVAQSTPSQDLLPRGLLVSNSTVASGLSSTQVSVPEQLTDVRRQDRQQNAIKRQQLRGTALALLAFLEEEKARVLESVLSAMPDIMPWIPIMDVSPCASLHFLELTANTGPQAVRVASWAIEHARTCNLKSALDKSWTARQAVVPTPATQPARRARVSKCCLNGICLCRGKELKCFAVKNTMLRLLKAVFQRKDKEALAELQDGHIVARLKRSELPTVAKQSSWARSRAAKEGAGHASSAAEAEVPLLDQKIVWLHVALQYLKPYRPTFQLLQEVEEQPAGQCELAQTGEFLAEAELWANLDLSKHWTVQFFRIMSSLAPVSPLQPGRCLVVQRSAAEHVLWNGKLRQRRGGSKKRKAADWEQGSEEDRSTPQSTSAADPEEVVVEAASARGQAAEGFPEESDEGEASSDEDEDAEDWMHGLLNTHWEQTSVSLSAGADAPQVAEEEEEEQVRALIKEAMPAQAGAVPGVGSAANANEAGENALQGQDLLEQADVEQGEPPIDEGVAGEPPLPAPGAAQPRTDAEVVVEVEGGVLRYYSAGYFTATCQELTHGKCVLTRTAHPGRRRAQGRPLGLLTAWLAAGHEHASKQAHWCRARWPDFEARFAARVDLANQAGGQELLARERPQEPGEAEEPDAVP